MLADPKNKNGIRERGVIQKADRNGVMGWYARVIIVHDSGRKKQILKKAANRNHARRPRDELKEKLDGRGVKAIDGDRMRFLELAELYETKEAIRRSVPRHGGRATESGRGPMLLAFVARILHRGSLY